MTTFAFSGRTRTGDPVSGKRVADSVDAAVAALRREQILVTQIDSVTQKRSFLGRLSQSRAGKPV